MECVCKYCKVANQCYCKKLCRTEEQKINKEFFSSECYKELVFDSLKSFYKNDVTLLEIDAYEPAVSGKFAMILNNFIKNKYFRSCDLNVDVEYNRHGVQDKEIFFNICQTHCFEKQKCEYPNFSDHYKRTKNIRPDIL